MKTISNRVRYQKDKDQTYIEIDGAVKDYKLIMLIVWFLLWTSCGVMVIKEYGNQTSDQIKIALIVYLVFWSYFEYRIGRAVIFKLFGKEIIKASKSEIAVGKKGKSHENIKTFNRTDVQSIKLHMPTENSFIQQLNNSYWVLGGEKLALESNDERILFGIQLSEHEAKEVLKLIK